MNLSIFKVGASFIIFIFNILSVIAPCYLTTASWISKAESLAGGIFIGAALIHLFPEASNYYTKCSSIAAILIIILSFFFMYFVQKCAGNGSHLNHSHNNGVLYEENMNSCDFGTIDRGIKKTTMFLFWALVFHCAVEAIVLGVIADQTAAIALFVALIGHKPVEAFALGLNVLQSHPTKKRYMQLMISFASVSPLTILIFLFLGNRLPDMFTYSVTAFSCGVFLFVGFHEVTEMIERTKLESQISKFTSILMFITGICWMGLMSLIE